MTFKTNNFSNPIFKLLFLLITFFLLNSGKAFSQEEKKEIPDGTEGIYFEVPAVDSATGKPIHPAPNEWENYWSTFKLGLGFVYDFATYSQDDVARQQNDSLGASVGPTFKLRDLRISASGRIKTQRTITWKIAFTYDGVTDKWLMRETGVIIGVPELAGHIFIGRTKEGYSMVKTMNGYSILGLERQMALDVIPIFGDGIKWYGYLPKSRIFWNVGAFNDAIGYKQTYSTFAWSYDARIGWMPFYDKEKNKLIHIATSLRYAKPEDNKITLKSRPESNPSPTFINTGEFAADHSNHIGGEIYYSSGPFLIGSEVNLHNFTSKTVEDHSFFGGDFVLSYIFTGSNHPYNTVGSIYTFVPVKKPVLKGGWGEWEGVLRFSSLHLNDGSIQGGQFWRITPMINWYLSKTTRIEFIYGYGVLDRFNLKGTTQFFESRLQIFAF